ncbi:MAG: SGNH/GDSL hydrolase family protein [Candidatus Gastranaerophilaceae bacterium]
MNLKNIAVSVLASVFLTGCAGTDVIKPEQNFYEKSVERSISSQGKTSLLSVVERAKAGKPVNIAYVGSSITAGEGLGSNEKSFAQISFGRLKMLFGGGNNVKYLNFSKPGSNSMYANIFLLKKIIASNPDIVFLEFSLNDKETQEFRLSYEYLVRELLSSKNHPPVISVITCDRAGKSVAEQIKQISKYYGMPVVSVPEAMMPEWTTGRENVNGFFVDDNLFSAAGHERTAEFVVKLFENVLSGGMSFKVRELPVPMYPGVLKFGVDFVPISQTKIYEQGSFVKNSSNCLEFDASKSDETSLSFLINSKNVFVVSENAVLTKDSTVEFDVNGKKTFVASNFHPANPVIYEIYSGETAKDLIVDVKVKNPGAEIKFDVCGVGINGNPKTGH